MGGREIAKLRAPRLKLAEKLLDKCLKDIEEEERIRRMQLISDIGCISVGTIFALVCVLMEFSEMTILLIIMGSEWTHGWINYKKHL